MFRTAVHNFRLFRSTCDALKTWFELSSRLKLYRNHLKGSKTQPLRVVELGRGGTSHGTYESRSCLFPILFLKYKNKKNKIKLASS